jgi:L-threonylcarbamoyladenylate synthase
VPLATAAEITRAADTLRAGGLVAFPTETVYGLGADAASPEALKRLFVTKGRPADHPVIVHLGAAAQLADWAVDVPPAAHELVAACWPGPLTLVVRRAAHVSDRVTGGLDTVGLRVPDQPLALALLREFGGGVAAPSANRFGRVSPTCAADVRADLGEDVDVVLDGGPSRVGVESTIVDLSGAQPAILRMGGVPRERVEAVLGSAVRVLDRGEVRAPGTLASHYAPSARVAIVTASELAARARRELACDRRVGVVTHDAPTDLDPRAEIVGTPSDDDEYARELYRYLRQADARGLDLLLVVPPAAVGIGAAVVDRLRRAATTPARDRRL